MRPFHSRINFSGKIIQIFIEKINTNRMHTMNKISKWLDKWKICWITNRLSVWTKTVVGVFRMNQTCELGHLSEQRTVPLLFLYVISSMESLQGRVSTKRIPLNLWTWLSTKRIPERCRQSCWWRTNWGWTQKPVRNSSRTATTIRAAVASRRWCPHGIDVRGSAFR